jgi:monofunctional biosynthetic peptidoglycan transglycosylase
VGVVLVASFACVSYSWLTLPDVRPLRRTNPATTAFMDLRAAEARAGGRELKMRQRWLPYSRISPTLRKAVISTEDAAFFDHDGIDLDELQASFELNWARGTFLRGGSTITQQLAKNLYLSPTRNPYRKVVELMIARQLEANLTKTRILELYLNLIEWGDGIWGADAAAYFYFGRSAGDLTMEQAALMAGAIINPRMLSIAHPSGRLLRRQQIILSRINRGVVAPAETEATPTVAASPQPAAVVEPPPEPDEVPISPPEPASPQ